MAEDYIPKTEAKDDLLKDIHTYNTSFGEKGLWQTGIFCSRQGRQLTAPVRYGMTECDENPG